MHVNLAQAGIEPPCFPMAHSGGRVRRLGANVQVVVFNIQVAK
jgi:hypothetical protein